VGRGKAGPGPEKHLPYFRFVKGLARAGCPICNQTRVSLDEWLANLLEESVNDRTLRRRFDAERGFCARHALRLCSFNDGLGAAILYRGILERAASSLDRGARPPINEGKCAACEYEADAESRHVGLVADFLDEEEMRSGLAASSGLCMPHVAAVMDLRRDPPRWFLELHRAACAGLLDVLRRYIDAQAFSTEKRREALGPEDEIAWRKLAPLLTGERCQTDSTGG
jgi:hypothetical protein